MILSFLSNPDSFALFNITLVIVLSLIFLLPILLLVVLPIIIYLFHIRFKPNQNLFKRLSDDETPIYDYEKDYKQRISRCLENAQDEREAIESLKSEFTRLINNKHEYKGHLLEQAENQLHIFEKYINMFEYLQSDRKAVKLNNQSKHVLDEIWD